MRASRKTSPLLTLAATERIPTVKKLQSGRSELRRVFESFPTGDRARITLLRDNVAAWVARWRLLGEPRRTLDVTYFLLGDDAFGVSFLGRLLAHLPSSRGGLDGEACRLGRGVQPEQSDRMGHAGGRCHRRPVTREGRSGLDRVELVEQVPHVADQATHHHPPADACAVAPPEPPELRLGAPRPGASRVGVLVYSTTSASRWLVRAMGGRVS